jgi:hypothetical protein
MYHVLGNITHDRKVYRKGDTIELTEAQAAPLLRKGIVATEAPTGTMQEAETPKPKTVPKPKPKVVGGKPLETGEPSIDGPAKAPKGEATDITPPTDQQDPSADL